MGRQVYLALCKRKRLYPMLEVEGNAVPSFRSRIMTCAEEITFFVTCAFQSRGSR